MARRPFFSGNYGSALGSTANAANLIARAGQQQGQMFQNLGTQIGGMIQQYGLNKEKREAEERTAIGNLSNFSPQDLLQLEQTNPELGRAVKNLLGGKGGKKDVDTINAGTAPFVAAKANERDARLQESIITGNQFKNELNEATRLNQIYKSTLETEGEKLLNDYRKQQRLISEIEADLKSNERDFDRDKRNIDLAKAKEGFALLREEVIAKRNNNLVFKEQFEAQKTKDAVALNEAMT